MAASLHQPGRLEQKIHDGKALEMSLGVDGFLIYDLKFLKCLQSLFEQDHQPVQDKYTVSDLLSIPKGKVTLKGLVKNIKVGILFISSWMVGKGSLIWGRFWLWLKTPKKVPKHFPEHLLDIAPGSNLALFFGDMNQSKNLSVIKPPLKELLFWMETLKILQQLKLADFKFGNGLNTNKNLRHIVIQNLVYIMVL